MKKLRAGISKAATGNKGAYRGELIIIINELIN